LSASGSISKRRVTRRAQGPSSLELARTRRWDFACRRVRIEFDMNCMVVVNRLLTTATTRPLQSSPGEPEAPWSSTRRSFPSYISSNALPRIYAACTCHEHNIPCADGLHLGCISPTPTSRPSSFNRPGSLEKKPCAGPCSSLFGRTVTADDRPAGDKNEPKSCRNFIGAIAVFSHRGGDSHAHTRVRGQLRHDGDGINPEITRADAQSKF